MIPKLSVLLPVYNAQRYVRKAVESVLGQTYREFELIIIDDGSKDGSGAILEELARGDSRIRVVRRENRGLVATLNEGLELAVGELLVRMDADDIALPGRFAMQEQYLRKYPECVGVGTQVLFIDSEDREIAPRPQEYLTHDAIDKALMSGEWPLVHPSMMMRAETLKKIGGYRDYLTWEDHDLFLRLAEVGKLANIPEVGLKYRLHLNSVVHQRGNGRSTVLQEILQQADARRGLSIRAVAELPTYQAPTREEHERTWAWWALAAGNIATARYYGRRAWCHSPWSWSNTKLILCTLRGK